MRRRVWVNLTVFGIGFVVMVGWLTQRVVSVKSLDNPYTVSADFSNAFGVLPNAEVTYLGVTYGQVSKVSRIPGGVRVDMSIERGRKIPEQADANIFRKSAIGEQYVDFSPPTGFKGDNGPWLKRGAHLPMTRTHVPLEFSELLRSASALVGSIPPDAVAKLLDAAATGLEGRTDSLRALAEGGDQLSAALATHTDALDRLADNGTRLTHVVAEHRGSLGSSLTDLRNVADSLRNAKGDTAVLLDRGSRLLTQVADVIANQKGNLDCDLKTLELVIDSATTPERVAGLRGLLRVGPTAFARLWDARDVDTTGPYPGVWLRVGFVANPVHDRPDQFTPPKDVPPVKAVPACASPLRPSGVNYTAGSTAIPATLPPAAGDGILLLLLSSVGALAVLRETGGLR
ncbi:MAG TPA: MCE family protein [Acidimicrobiales bacterium]|nr:MCE family protein [Acidimicrobiales bacterium]